MDFLATSQLSLCVKWADFEYRQRAKTIPGTHGCACLWGTSRKLGLCYLTSLNQKPITTKRKHWKICHCLVNLSESPISINLGDFPATKHQMVNLVVFPAPLHVQTEAETLPFETTAWHMGHIGKQVL